MDSDPAHVIRSLRLALEMSQAEFARAAGWSPSTISSWERGRVKPSRLAFKTILAFAEERGVRYRPRATSTALVPIAPAASAAYDSGSTAARGPRAALRPLLYPDVVDALPSNQEGGHRAPPQRSPWFGPPFDAAPHQGERVAHASREDTAPRWSAEASFRVTLGARGARRRAELPRGAIEIAVVGVAFCIALAVGLPEPLRHLLRPRAAPTTARNATSVTVPLHAAASQPLAPARAHGVAPAAVEPLGTMRTVPPAAAARVAATEPEPVDDDPRAALALQPPELARLESVLEIHGSGRATFRTANDSITVVIGDWLGGLQVAAIGGEGVTLVDQAGVTHRVRLGHQLVLE